MKSGRRCELKVWDNSTAKRNGEAPMVTKGSPIQIVIKILDLFVLVGEDIDKDFEMMLKGLRRR